MKKTKDKESTYPGTFRGKDGLLYVVRCPECKKENYSMAVCTGVCAWCGWCEKGDKFEENKRTS